MTYCTATLRMAPTSPQTTAPAPAVATVQPTVNAIEIAVLTASPTHCATVPWRQSSTVMNPCRPMPMTARPMPANLATLPAPDSASAAGPRSPPSSPAAPAAEPASAATSLVAPPALPALTASSSVTVVVDDANDDFT